MASSPEKPTKRDSASKGITAMGKGDARRKGSANAMDVVEEVPAVREDGGMKGVASRAPNGVKRESKSRGTEGGGVAKVKIVEVNGKSLSWMGLTRERWCCTMGLVSRLDMNTCQTSIKTDVLL